MRAERSSECPRCHELRICSNGSNWRRTRRKAYAAVETTRTLRTIGSSACGACCDRYTYPTIKNAIAKIDGFDTGEKISLLNRGMVSEQLPERLIHQRQAIDRFSKCSQFGRRGVRRTASTPRSSMCVTSARILIDVPYPPQQPQCHLQFRCSAKVSRDSTPSHGPPTSLSRWSTPAPPSRGHTCVRAVWQQLVAGADTTDQGENTSTRTGRPPSARAASRRRPSGQRRRSGFQPR